MIQNNKQVTLIFILFFSFVGVWNTNAQESPERIPLTTILNQIETQYNYQFNYAEETIAGISIVKPNANWNFEEILNYLRQETKLTFTVSNRFIIIHKPKKNVLCGYLLDFETLLPIASATIESKSDATTSDDKGYFELQSNSELLTIRHISYKTVIRQLKNQESCAKIYLQPNVESLQEIIISNYINSGISKLSNGSFQIDFDNFDILPGVVETDVLLAVQAFPGVQSTDETVSNINIRGGANDQNLVLWDDIKMYQSGHFFGLISMYNPQITQKVILRKNGTDASYTDGVSGTIAMETDKNINNDFKASVGMNFIDANTFIDLPISKKSSVQIAARKSISDFLETPTYTAFFDRISDNTEVETNEAAIFNTDKTFDFYDVSFRWLYEISDKDFLRLNFINIANELVFDENAIVNTNEITRQSSLSQNSIAGGLQYKRFWNKKLETEIDIYNTDYKLKAINANILDSQRFLQENAVSETSVKASVNYKFNERFKGQIGYHFIETGVTNLDDVDNPIFRLKVAEVIRVHSAFTQVSFTSNNRNTFLNLGVRANYVDKFDTIILEPRLSFNQKFLKHFNFEILGEFKHQTTSQIINFQNDFLGIEKRRWQLSNTDDIPIMLSKQISSGITFNNSGWLLSAEGYFKMVDGITSQSQGFQNQYQFTTTSGSYEVYGIDVLLRKNIKQFNAWLSYAFMDNMYQFPELAEPQFPSNYDITHSVTLGTSYSAKKLKLSAGLNWHTGKPIAQPITGNEIVNNQINYSPTNTNRLQDYMRVDISALYTLNLGDTVDAKLGVSIWNVLNDDNIINSFYTLNNAMLTQTDELALGFTPNAFLRVYF
uniref:TonB-dependent receptor n=1 Tax=Gelidibacter sp. TaxID=2018083 RepID=UPI00404B5790